MGVALIALSSSVCKQAAAEFRYVIDVPPEIAPQEIGAFTQLNLADGGVLPEGFRAGFPIDRSLVPRGEEHVEVNILGGEVGDDFNAFAGSRINISGGVVGERFWARGDNEINIDGGVIGNRFRVMRSNQLHISGGRIGHDASIDSSNFRMSGGEIGENLSVQGTILLEGGSVGAGLEAGFGTRVTIDGADVGSFFDARFRSTVKLRSGGIGYAFRSDRSATVEITGGGIAPRFQPHGESDVSIHGSDFLYDGVPVTDLSDIGPFDRGTLTGVLSDGSAFFLSSLTGDRRQGIRLVETLTPGPEATPALIGEGVQAKGLRPGQTATLVAGGRLPNGFAVVNATLNLEGGVTGEGVRVLDGTLNMSGGTLGSRFKAVGQSGANLSGGVFGRGFESLATSVSGGDFRLNGVPIDVDQFGGSVAGGGVLSGILEDGSPFIVSDRMGDRLGRIDLIEKPITMADTRPIIEASPSALRGLRPGQSLTLLPGGELSDGLAAVEAVLHVEGGVVGDRLDSHNTTVNLGAGRVGRSLHLVGGDLNISGGRLGGGARVQSLGGDSPVTRVRLTGGSIGDELRVGDTFRENQGAVVTVSGGEVGRAAWFSSDSKLEVVGGEVGDHLEVAGELSVSGGQVGSGASVRGQTTIQGGTVGDGFSFSGHATISGGRIGDNARVGQFGFRERGVATISGGVIGNGFSVGTLSEATLEGGRLGQGVVASGERLSIRGADFRLNGQPVTDPAAPVTLEAADTFTGVLQDGTPFVFSHTAGDRLTEVRLVEVSIPQPGSLEPGAPISGLRRGQSVVLSTGQSIGDHAAAIGALIEARAGSEIGEGLELVESSLAVTGGAVGDRLTAYAGSRVDISGGRVDARFNALAGSTVEVSGGRLGRQSDPFGPDFFDSFVASRESRAAISGGSWVGNVIAQSGSEVDVSGGSFANLFSAHTGAEVTLAGGRFNQLGASGGTVITGGEFLLNGAPVSAGAVVSLGQDDVLTGTFADGSAFIFSPKTQDSLSGVRLQQAEGLPDAKTTPYVIDSNEAPYGLRLGESLRLMDQGVLPSLFDAVDAELVVSGGRTAGMELVRSELVVEGGVLSGVVRLFEESVAEISGGDTSGATLIAEAGSELRIFGYDFFLNDSPLSLVPNEAFYIDQPYAKLSGRLADGTEFSHTFQEFPDPFFPTSHISRDAFLSIVFVPEPSGIVGVVLLGGGCGGWRARTRKGSSL